jgi:histidyl-tRNA synthetase
MSVHLAKGTRDHLPDAMRRRLAVTDVLRGVFARHGFDPLETPAIERIETLLGKYGDEGSKLIFKILKRGEGAGTGDADLALRYDLTVPLARVIAMNPGLRMPFKRWQIAPVWRAERPGRGRFREFVQCDVDIIGSSSALAEAECLSVAHDALTALGLHDGVLRVNDRRLLAALARTLGAADREGELLVAVDKLDKIGRDGVSAELRERGFPEAAIEGLWRILDVDTGDRERVLAHLEAHLDGDDVRAATDRVREVIALAMALGVPSAKLLVDPTLARGLDYYTGPVFEIALTEGQIGSAGGGGRYDGLIGKLAGRADVPAVGLSLGLERLLVVLEERGMMPGSSQGVEVLVTLMDETHRPHAAAAAAQLRDAGLRVELILDLQKLGKQFKHADALGARWVLTIGPSEAAAGVVALKDLSTGEQHQVPLADVIRRARAS